jgi:tetratricopeptide (TPR) repeat protein
MSELIGQRQNKLLARLCDEWLQRGRPVCTIEGFPGVGKTDLAERLIALAKRKSVYVECPEKDIDATSDFLAHLGEDLAAADYPAMADAGQDQKAQLNALYETLLEPILIVVDEFQNTMIGRTGKPTELLAKFLETASRDHRLQGRILILTNRTIDRVRWSERFELHSFPELDSAEAVQFLVDLLAKWDRSEDVPPSRREEVVEGLGKNPRALTTLVHCLADEPLDDLFGPSRDAWEIDERQVSPQLAARIEEEILKRSMKHLEHESLVFLRRLCVHRISLRKQALEYMVMPGTDPLQLVSDLTQRFMLAQRRGFYQIHPLVHAIARERWAADSREMVNAHSAAADFYARPFKAKQLIVSGRTGGQFAELRYHLNKSGRTSDLGEFHQRIIGEISQYWFETTPIPKDTSERDDHITLLSSVLVSPGPDKLEAYLVRLLCARGRTEDIDRACVHARRVAKQSLYQSCGEMLAKAGRIEEAITLLKEGMAKLPPNQPLYQSCGEMLGKAGRIEEAITLLKEGIAKVPPSQNLFSLYQSCGEMLGKADRIEEAITLLKEGMAKLPPNQPLYQSCGEMLGKAGRLEEAITLLKEGIAKVPPNQPLYQSCGEMLGKAGRLEEAITLLKESIAKVPPNQSLFSLYQICGEMLAHAGHIDAVIPFLREGARRVPDALGGNRIVEAILYHAAAIGDVNVLDDPEKDLEPRTVSEVAKLLGQVLALQVREQWKQAAERAAYGREKYPFYLNFTIQESFSWLCAQLPDRAPEALLRFPGGIRGGEGNPIEWLQSNIALARGDHDKAKQYAATYLGDTPIRSKHPIQSLLIDLWVQDKFKIGGLRITYYHPTLPSSVTGLDKSLNRFIDDEILSEAVDLRPVRVSPDNGLERKVRATLSSAYFVKRLNDTTYQASFENAGKDKAESVLQKFSELSQEHQARYAYVSIGGADGSEIAWAMNNSPISKGVLLEYGTDAAASARKRISHLMEKNKTLVVLEGDAMQKLGELSQKLNDWKQAGDIDGILVSAQSVLHELPYRSPGFNANVFFGHLFKGWDNVFFCCREPCGPQGWPKIVQLKLKDVSGDTLAAMAQHVKAHLGFSGDVHSIANDYVEMPSDLALEVLFKVLYLDNTFAYEMGERLTAFDPERVSKILERYLGANSVQIEYTMSGHFKQAYQREVDLAVDADTQSPLRMPNSFARITAARRNA